MPEGETSDGDTAASTGDLVSALPNVHDWLSSLLGINLPHLPPLPQTVKNFDKAMGRLVLATGESLSSRLENNTAVRRAKTLALESAVKASAKEFVGQIKGGGSQFERSVEYTFGENILYQKNREDIARLTFQEMGSETQNEASDADSDISDDWLNAFSDIVGKKSNEDIQRLWSKILAGEIRKPGTFRLKSLLSMAAIDSSDAMQINLLLAKAVNGDFILRASQDEDLTPYMNAESLDVLSVGGGMVSRTIKIPEKGIAYFVIGNVVLGAQTDIARTIQIPMYVLNQFGRDLYALSSYTNVDENYIQSLISTLKTSGVTVKRAYVVSRTGASIIPSPFIDC